MLNVDLQKRFNYCCEHCEKLFITSAFFWSFNLEPEWSFLLQQISSYTVDSAEKTHQLLSDSDSNIAKSWLVHRSHDTTHTIYFSQLSTWSCLRTDIFRAFNVGMNIHNHDTLTAALALQLPSYRVISSLHSSGALALLGTDRKRVVLSVEGWSRLRTQHSSPDLDHWPANTQRHSEISAISRKLVGNDLTLRENIWPLLKVALSCRSSSRLTKMLWGMGFSPTDRWSMEAWECAESRYNSKISIVWQ